jgi:hypothetical protein
MDADDVRMPQFGGDVGFAAESLPVLAIRGQGRR